MITNEEKEGWHYLPVKKLSALLHGITSKYKGDFYCMNCLHYFRTKNKLKSHEKACKNKDRYFYRYLFIHIPTMFKLLVLLFVIKLYARNDFFF